MKTLRFILGDQLNLAISSLHDIDPEKDIVLMVEVRAESTKVPHHQQKIVLVLSAMRHFADALREQGIRVDYVSLDDPTNTHSFTNELHRALARHQVDKVVITEPGEWRVGEMMQVWKQTIKVPVEIQEDDRFLCSRAEFINWAQEHTVLRMELFYRMMRRKTGWLMRDDQPIGNRWNYDKENRKSLPRMVFIPPSLRFAPDPITAQVMQLVRQHFPSHFSELESFTWGVTRADALAALQHFITNHLSQFGDFQDAMRSGEDTLFHSTLSPYLNIGLLDAREVCTAAINVYQDGTAPLNAVEGFIRQILGWREFIRGVYWLFMPGYQKTNFFDAHRPLPDFYWTGKTDLNCLREVILSTHHNAYAHHIQRLMLTGNFALLAGIEPAQVEEWYLVVYADAFEWVELPNTHGMALYADGGRMSSKPYAASGVYINRMSNYCATCTYDPNVKLGTKACPFNYLYWYFLIVNQEKLKSNPRMVIPYRTLGRMPTGRQQQIIEQAEAFLAQLSIASELTW